MADLLHSPGFVQVVQALERAKDGPVLTNPRLDNALSFLRDVHLLDDSGLTDTGRALAEAA